MEHIVLHAMQVYVMAALCLAIPAISCVMNAQIIIDVTLIYVIMIKNCICVKFSIYLYNF